MDRVYQSSVSGTPPAAPSVPLLGYPRAGDPISGTKATRPGPWWFHMMTEELRNVIVAAGLTPDSGNLGQLAEAITSIGSLPPGALVDFGFAGPVPGFIDADGSVPLISSVPALAAAIYCGDANNSTAEWGYRCTNPASPTTTRSIAGNYIVLLDARGRFRRTLSGGSSLDAGRSLWSYQLDDNKAHTHSLGTLRDNNNNESGNLPAGASFGNFGTYATQSSGTESRPFNYAATTKFKL